ncbi:MAG: GNAT family N-acetyltransferase [Erysipelotrichia bacterium]|nr:GNAT family N-acetyltransferase [Erysipelotrichia bacterium]
MFTIVDYDINKHKLLDDWIDESKYINVKTINKYATYHEPISETYQYFLDNPFDMANIKSFIKVFERDGISYAVTIFHYYNDNDKYYLAINPIIINPKLINQGIGTIVLKLIVLKAKKIAEGKVDIIKGDTEKTNVASLRIFEKSGFIKSKKNDDFIEYIYKLTN